MKIVVIGPGALGCLLAASLLRSESLSKASTYPQTSLVLLDSSPERAAQISTQGLILEDEDETISIKAQATADPNTLEGTDLFLLCVKSGDVPSALSRISPLLTEKSLVITFQNGIGHLPLVNPWTLPGKAALGVTAQGANMVAPGHVRHAGNGPTFIGFPNSTDSADLTKLSEVAALFTSAGLTTKAVSDILDRVWGKLLVNVGINALTAIHDCPNGELLAIPAAHQMLIAAVEEAITVARTKRITIQGDPVSRTEEVCRATAQNISSMLQDVRRKKSTEIAAINGAIADEAHRLDIATPINELLVRQVREIENSYLL